MPGWRILSHQISLQARCAPVGCLQLPRGRDHVATWLFEEMILFPSCIFDSAL
jgi:hypothetical protein